MLFESWTTLTLISEAFAVDNDFDSDSSLQWFSSERSLPNDGFAKSVVTDGSATSTVEGSLWPVVRLDNGSKRNNSELRRSSSETAFCAPRDCRKSKSFELSTTVE